MIDISKQAVELDCPDCKKKIKVTLKQIADEATIKCTCGQSIKLTDSKGSAKKSIRDINKSFKDLERTFKKLGK
jgi:hypothetical protein